jgi:glucose/arabinose dehydrogenase
VRRVLAAVLWLGGVAGCECGGEGAAEQQQGVQEGREANHPAASKGANGVGAVDLVPGTTFELPVFVIQAPGDSKAFYVVEQPGRIRVVRDGAVRPEAFLDMADRVDFGGERGLLGLAFHPDYERNGRFFVYYTPAVERRNVLAEYRRSDSDRYRADSAEVRRLLEPRDPRVNHNGGMIAFGPDGYLYVGMGDGGGRCDRFGEIGNAQDLGSLFGKLHRLDVDAPERGFAARGNPFEGREGAREQVWAYGLRNPWRFSFDRQTRDLYIGDVGQDEFEEVNWQPADSGGGENYGWRDFEGLASSTVSGCKPTGRVREHAKPIVVYALDSKDDVIRGGCSVIGGYVYRGDAIPELRGSYLYGDYCSDDVAAFRHVEGRVEDHRRLDGLRGLGEGLASFGEDHAGELYVVFQTSGHVKRIAR